MTAPSQLVAKQKQAPKPLIVGHRGACGYRPEHTLASYELAIKMGVDFIEPDVVATKDGHLIIRHEPMLSETTDILARPEFADRKRMRNVDGHEITDFFACDLTLVELKTLRAKQAFADRDHSYDGQFAIATLAEAIDLAAQATKDLGREIGLYPEIKHSTFHAKLGLAIEPKLLDMLERASLNRAHAPVIIQSFEQGNLMALRKKTPVRLMQLISGSDIDPLSGDMVLRAPDERPYDWVISGRKDSYADMLTPKGMSEIASYTDIIAPWKRYLLSFKTTHDGTQTPVFHRDIIDNAHALGLKVHSWTMRNDRLEAYYQNDPVREYQHLFEMGIDGLFSDFPDTAVTARTAFMNG